MRFQIVALAATHLARQTVGQALVPLGARVLEFSGRRGARAPASL